MGGVDTRACDGGCGPAVGRIQVRACDGERRALVTALNVFSVVSVGG